MKHNLKDINELPIFEFLDNCFEFIIGIAIFILIILVLYLIYKSLKGTKKTSEFSSNTNINKEERPLESENELSKKCRNELKEISKIENTITNFEIKELVQDIVELSVKIVRLADEDDVSRMRNFYNYYIPQFHKILTSYKTAMDANLNLDYVKDLEIDTIKSFKVFKDSLKKLLEEVLRNDLDNIDVEMKVFEEFLKGKGLGDSDFNL